MRIYPLCCQSAFCGRADCTDCRNKPLLDEFKEWVKKTGAVVRDPIWNPSIYTIPGKENRE